MPKKPSQQELFAFSVMRHAAGIDVRQLDDNTSPRMVDGWWPLGGSRRGVVEVTTLIDEAAAKLEKVMHAANYQLPADGLRFQWLVQVSPRVQWSRLRSDLGPLLRSCESDGVNEPHCLRYRGPLDYPLADYIERGDLEAHHLGQPNSGWVYVQTQGDSCVVPDMDAVADWLGQALVGYRLASDLAKLDRAEADERHLFLGIHDTGVAFEILAPFWEAKAVPRVSLQAPTFLDGVWLLPIWRVPILVWRRGSGWSRHNAPTTTAA